MRIARFSIAVCAVLVCGSATAPSTVTSQAAYVAKTTPLILEKEAGEPRVWRVEGSQMHFILKVDPQNGGSSHLVLGTEDLPPEGKIDAHRHPGSDEVLFLQNGTARVNRWICSPWPRPSGTPSKTLACGTKLNLLISSGRFSRAVRAAKAFVLVSGMVPMPFSFSGIRNCRILPSTMRTKMATSSCRTRKALEICSAALSRADVPAGIVAASKSSTILSN